MDHEQEEFMRLLRLHPECRSAVRRMLDPSGAAKEESTALEAGEGGRHGSHESKRRA